MFALNINNCKNTIWYISYVDDWRKWNYIYAMCVFDLFLYVCTDLFNSQYYGWIYVMVTATAWVADMSVYQHVLKDIAEDLLIVRNDDYNHQMNRHMVYCLYIFGKYVCKLKWNERNVFCILRINIETFLRPICTNWWQHHFIVFLF